MKGLLLVLSVSIFSLNILAQDIYPSNKTISSLEKNILFNIQKRKLVEQTGSGLATSKLDVNELFNGSFLPSYTPSGIVDSIAITIHDVTTYHTQAGAWIGWSTRAWGPTKFKIQVYNTYDNPPPGVPDSTWTTIVDTTGYNKQDYLKKITGVIPNKVRFIFYAAGGSNGRLGISELFLIHPEAGQAYDNLLPKYDRNMNMVLGDPASTPDSTRGDLAIYAKTAPDNRASLKIGYDPSNNLEIYRDRTAPDIYFKTNQASAGHMRFVTNNSNFTFNGGKVGIGITSPNAPLQFASILANRIIVLNEGGNNDHQFYGLGISSAMLRFQIASTGGAYGFFAGSNATSSVEVARITGNGRLGIGTTSPISAIHLAGSSGNAIITLQRPTNSPSSGIGAVGFSNESNKYLSSVTSTYGADTTQAYLSFRTGVPNTNAYLLSERMRIDKDGNVGVGGAASTKFHIMGSGVVGSRIQSTDNAAIVTIYGTYGQVLSQNDLYLSASGTSGNLYFQTQGSTRGVVDAGGKFGIGQLNASNVLDVNTGASAGYGNYALVKTSVSVGYQGGLLLSNYASATTGTSFKMTSSYNGSSSATARFGFVANTDTENFMNSGAALEFFYNGNVAIGQNSGNVLLTQGSGNVGVGTNNIPSGYKMAVAGNLIAEKVKVKKRVGGIWPDYVFSPTYKLPSLEEIEVFTKKNGHLPEIPSAKEIEKDGQDLGEMNGLLLKKVEELTLYLIDLKKQNDKLNTLIESQNKKIAQQDIEIEKLKHTKK